MDSSVVTTGGDVREETRAFNARLQEQAQGQPRPEQVGDLEQLRRPGAMFPAPEVLEVGVDREVPGRDGPVRVRVFTPPRVQGAYLHLHPGGGVLGSARSSDERLWRLAQATSCAVVTVDYRLAPEDPFPAGVHDCVDAARWLAGEGAAGFGVERLVVGGESQGAYLAVQVLLRLRREDPQAAQRFTGAYLAYGVYDLSMTPSLRSHGDQGLVISTATERWFFDQFLGPMPVEDRRDAAVSPLYADLAGLPPARFVVGTSDPLLDDTLFMAARWRAAGSPAELAVVDSATHGFTAFPVTVARREEEESFRFLRDRVRG